MTPNYKLKSEIIELGLDKVERNISLTRFKTMRESQREAITGEIVEEWKPYSVEQANIYENFIKETYGFEYWQESIRVNRASYQRKITLSNRIKDMLLKGQCFFLTLTFTDKVLDNTNQLTRRRYITRWLKDNCIEYVANIDYGSKKGREHYHAVVLTNHINALNYKYGNLDFEKIFIDNDCQTRLAKYVCKLSNHAIKETCKRNAMIYSR